MRGVGEEGTVREKWGEKNKRKVAREDEGGEERQDGERESKRAREGGKGK